MAPNETQTPEATDMSTMTASQLALLAQHDNAQVAARARAEIARRNAEAGRKSVL